MAIDRTNDRLTKVFGCEALPQNAVLIDGEKIKRGQFTPKSSFGEIYTSGGLDYVKIDRSEAEDMSLILMSMDNSGELSKR